MHGGAWPLKGKMRACPSTLPPWTFAPYAQEGIFYVQLMLKETLCFTFLSVKSLKTSFGIPLHRKFVFPLIYTCNHLFIVVCTLGYLWYTLGSNQILLYMFLLKMFCIYIMKAFIFSFGVCVPLTYVILTGFFFCLFVCFNTFSLFGTLRPFRLIICISCPSCKSSHFIKQTRYFVLENGIRTDDLNTRHAAFFSGAFVAVY